MQVFPAVQKYIDAVEKKAVSKPDTKSFLLVQEWCKDPLVLAKLYSFHSIAKQLSPFLISYQTDKPMIPFLSTDLETLLKGLMNRFIKGDVMKSATSAIKLLKIDPTDEGNYCHTKKIDVGYSANREISELLSSKQISDLRVMEFRKNCQAFLIETVRRLLLKCPLGYSLVRNSSCLDPRILSNSKKLDECKRKLKNTLDVLVDARQVKESDCDDILQQYGQFMLDIVPLHREFREFDPYRGKVRIDKLFYDTMSTVPTMSKVWKVVKLILTLSHGQASVERGFSVNRNIESENMTEKTFVALRVICDHVNTVGGIEEVKITPALLQSASNARQRYQMYLDEEKKKQYNEDQGKKRKKLLDDVDSLKKKKKRIENDMREMERSADEFALDAEEKGDITLVAKSNSLRNSCKEKAKSLKLVVAKLDGKLKELKNI